MYAICMYEGSPNHERVRCVEIPGRMHAICMIYAGVRILPRPPTSNHTSISGESEHYLRHAIGLSGYLNGIIVVCKSCN